MENREIIKLDGICKVYNRNSQNELVVLDDISLSVKESEFVSIVGRSGSGKSTLMNMIGMLDVPTRGRYLFRDNNVYRLKRKEISKFRSRQIGFIFQNFELVSGMSALKNVMLPMLYAGVGRKDAEKRAEELLEIMEMSERLGHTPEELSGGQKQRVAIARAVANNPPLILADEPTGALDEKTGRMVMDMLHRLNKQGKTIVLITHDNDLAAETSRIVRISDGKIIEGEEQQNDSGTFYRSLS